MTDRAVLSTALLIGVLLGLVLTFAIPIGDPLAEYEAAQPPPTPHTGQASPYPTEAR